MQPLLSAIDPLLPCKITGRFPEGKPVHEGNPQSPFKHLMGIVMGYKGPAALGTRCVKKKGVIVVIVGFGHTQMRLQCHSGCLSARAQEK